MYTAVLFDLDGTLADTAPDLGGALNRVLRAHGKAPLPLKAIRPYTSQGVRGLLRSGFGISPDAPEYSALSTEMLDQYFKHICDETQLFDGMAEVLDTLDAQGIAWGIVTNKHTRFTAPLIQALGLAQRTACVISGDSTAHPKPAPDPLLLAARQLARPPEACIYVGDDPRDILAAQAANMLPIAAQWGYLGMEAPIEDWGARHIISSPRQILDCLAPLR